MGNCLIDKNKCLFRHKSMYVDVTYVTNKIQMNPIFDKPDFALGIYRLRGNIWRDKAYRSFESDFIFFEGAPMLVLEWSFPSENRPIPVLTLPLDPDKIEEIPWEKGYYLYHGKLVDPRLTQ